MGVHAPWISHLLFADDCIIFSEASQRGAARIQEILDTYSKGSGQLVNFDKSAIFFSRNCDEHARQLVRQELHIETKALSDKYLGLPTALGQSITGTFEYLPSRIRGAIGSWSGREASSAGREVLLKSVAQAIPTYTMSCFLLSKTTCKKMRTAISNYWWGGSADNRHIHWLRWDRLRQHKSMGGMGFRDLHQFNKAMIGKQGWRLMTREDSLCARVLKGRYFHDSEFMQSTRKKHASHTWRSILAGKEALLTGLFRRIGNGETTHIWNDRWIPKYFDGRPLTVAANQGVTMVSELIGDDGEWNEVLLREIFIPIDADAILSIPLRLQDEDRWAWKLEKHGEYSVKSAYRSLDESNQRIDVLIPGGSGDPTWSKIWSLCVPPKVKVFWWRVLHEFLPAKAVLHRRHIEPTAFCEVCGADNETIRHTLLEECTTALHFWREIKLLTGAKIPRLHPHTWASDILLHEVASDKDRNLFIIGMYALWSQRNKRRHGEDQPPVQVTVQWAVDQAHDLWILSQSKKPARPLPKQTHWQKPREGWMKCNSDGAFYAGPNQGATGAVIRDSEGAFVVGGARWYPHGIDALMFEALACRDGALLARQQGIQKLQLETDSQELVNTWNSRDYQRTHLAPILEELREISLGFLEFTLSYTSRKCN